MKAIKTLALAAVVGLGLVGAAKANDVQPPQDDYQYKVVICYEKVTCYRTECEPYTKCVTYYDHCGYPYTVNKTFYRYVQVPYVKVVPVKKYVKVVNY